jgi:hypothetical protein
MPNVTAPNLVSFGSPASVIAPDIASEQLSLQRRQQIADLLKQQALAPIEQQTVSGAGPTRVVPFSPLQGVAKMMSAYLAGKSQDNIDAQNLNLTRQYASRMAQLLSDGTSTPPQTHSPASDAATTPSSDAVPQNAGPLTSDARPATADNSATAQDVTPDASQSPVQSMGLQVTSAATRPLVQPASPTDGAQRPGQNAFALGKLLRGMAIEQFGGAPAASAYWDQFKLPDAVKANNYYGLDPQTVAGGMRRVIANQGVQAVRPGGTLARTNEDGTISGQFTAPDLHTATNVTWQGGQPVATAIPGAAQIQGDLRYAQTAGEGAALPYAGFDAQGRPLPVASRTAAVTQAQQPAPVVTPSVSAAPNVPGAPASPTPNASSQSADADRTAIYQGELAKAQDRLANPAKYMAPADLAQDPDMSNFRARAQADIAGLTREMQRSGIAPGAASAGANPSGPVYAAPQPGYAESQAALATGNAKNYLDAVKLAADSPTRVNVYDNILNLSKSGVNSGPGSAWQNQVKGYVANTPFLAPLAKGWKDDVSGFQELNKFMYQNAQRNWQAAGGTGTDAQLEAFSHSNPNDKMFPQALQAMAQWGKAGELALQSKAAAMTNWKTQNGGNVANLDQFENQWRKSFDPQLFQLRAMDPATQAQAIAQLRANNPQAYRSLMSKAQTLQQLGGL